ncbi:hypothetical protein CL614_09405 [archaeon]|nr:hypothetical protein [archaeon]|tara:strand:- start:295 stop:1134 length:840 start_codon:yes stop_codon:yes gene_type:complete
MGLGGYLTWTAVARELYTRTGVKCFPLEGHSNLIKPIKSEIFDNNPYIWQAFSNLNEKYILLYLNDSKANYCKQDTPVKAVHRYDKHIIEQICEVYGILDPQLKCELYFKEEEFKFKNELLKDVGNYIVIEPQSNDEYSVNKVYPLEKWQLVVDTLLKTGIKIVQVGRKTEDSVLDGIIDMTGKTSFREAAAIIEGANLFVSSEGGLMHAANAVGTRAVIVYSGFIHPNLTSYSENTNIWAGNKHGPCGMKIKCQKCSEEMEQHDHNEIINAVIDCVGA